ncbi:uncharacterized protein RJT21DRAFT_33840 [Scheffersomyces amazonensis]|uniref:uncharacterized protein n=1 Tax=Scheffersomyces amazonensis TaxID=1078765 RepID=UPI00315DC100
MTTIIASGIPSGITQERVEKFFSFCGDISSIKAVSKTPTQSYEITFASPKALDTALLLNEAELDGTPIKVESGISTTSAATSSKDIDAPPQYSVGDGVAASTATGDHKVQHEHDDISQEEKPKYVIVTQLLANGYTLSDKIINKSIEFDKQKGYSSHFKNFLSGLDEKYIHSKEPESDFNKNLGKAQDKLSNLQNQFAKSSYSSKLSKYYDQAAQHPYGVKVHQFYKDFAKDVKSVHEEAKRISELQKSDGSTSTSSAHAATEATPATKE